MLRGTGVAAVVAVVAALVVSVAYAASAPHVTPRRAERNLLRAGHLLTRWHAGLTDPASGLVRPNTTAQCRGRGKGQAGRYFSFSCIIRNGSHAVAVTYVALRGDGFEIRNRKVLHR